MAELSQVLKQATGVVAARGEGVLLFDEDDRRYLDFTAGIGVTSTGVRGYSSRPSHPPRPVRMATSKAVGSRTSDETSSSMAAPPGA